MEPGVFLARCRKNIRREWIFAFCGAIVAGFAAHGYKMFNWLPNWDALVFYHSAQNMTNLGRPFLGLIDGLTSYYELPFLNCLLGLLWTAVSAVLVTEVLDIRRSVTACLTGALLAVSPAVTSTMYYAYTADGYLLMGLLGCMSVLAAVRRKRGFLLSAVCSLVICGCYPAYLSVAAVLWLLWAIKALVFDILPIREVLRKTVFFALGSGLGCAVFCVLLKLIYVVSDITVSDYQSIGSTLDGSSFSPLLALRNCYLTFSDVLFLDFDRINVYVILNVLMLLLLAVFGLSAVLM